ncbi:MAG TPA: DUF4270 family protein [Cyclobacteriaceae bacterium]
MSLWGRFAGYAFLAFTILISCREDDTSLLGFKKSNDKFKVSYQEVDVTSSVMAIDSVRTYNDNNLSYNRRLLVGKYVDEKFGEITAQAYTQFQPLVPNITISDQAKFVSGFLTLSFDFYHYGDDQTTTSNFFVHELLDSIPPVFDLGSLPKNVQAIPNYQPYYYNTALPYDPTPLGSAVFAVNPHTFDQRASDIVNNPSNLNPKTIDSLAIPLSSVFSSKLFLLARSQTNEYTVFSKFRRTFKGLVIRSGPNDSKVVGFNPAIDSTKFTKSRVIIYYDEPDVSTGLNLRKKLEYTLFNPSSSQLFGFSNISANRAGTQLAGLSKTNEDLELDGNRYYQSGNPITTKLNFDQFFAFADTIPNLIFNLVELSIEPEDVVVFRPPASLRLRYINASNEFINVQSNIPEESGLPIYPSMTYDEEGYLIIGKRFDQININPVSDLTYNSSTQSYSADLTDFFQSLYNIKDPAFRYTNFAIVAANPRIGLSVDRTFFNKEKIKLRIIYTVPVIKK